MTQTINGEIKKSNVHVLVEILEYEPDAVVSKTIIRKSSGNIVVSSLDNGEETAEKKVPYDTYVQVLEGVAEVTIEEKKYKLKTGEGIVIPANVNTLFKAKKKYKKI